MDKELSIMELMIIIMELGLGINQMPHCQEDYYAEAKHSEYELRDLPRALGLFKQAIRHGQKVDSAIKDAAAVLHQMGDTKAACNFLREHRHLVHRDIKKYDNLLKNLSKQIVPSGKFMTKFLLLDPWPSCPTAEEALTLFTNHSRVERVQFYGDLALDRQLQGGRYILLSFQSHSSAKKTLETLRSGVPAFWVNVNKLVVAKADPADCHFFSFYHGDRLWPWVTLLPDGEEEPTNGQGKWGEESQQFEMQRVVRKQENEWKASVLRV